ncbi:MAG TPA: ACT domain-containing protein [Anaerovoracaceae bacterium]|nr:ACT domain-containing protein [Anaerovoracaceae bacterium]
MIIKQLTVFLQNKSGRLEDLTDILAKNNINIAALSIAETEEYGIMRMIVSDHEKALQALKAAEFTVKTTDVVSIECPDIPGALHETLKTLTNNGIDVSYMYGYSNGGTARLIMKINNPEKAMEIIENNL